MDKRFLKKFILVAIVAIIIATSFVFAENIDVTEGKVLVRNDWVWIEAKGKYMHTSLYTDGTIVATKDKSFESVFNDVPGYYATDQEGYMLFGYVLYEGNLYYFQPAGIEKGKLLSNINIQYKGEIYHIDEFGRIQGDIKKIIDSTTVYTMGLLKE